MENVKVTVIIIVTIAKYVQSHPEIPNAQIDLFTALLKNPSKLFGLTIWKLTLD